MYQYSLVFTINQEAYGDSVTEAVDGICLKIKTLGISVVGPSVSEFDDKVEVTVRFSEKLSDTEIFSSWRLVKTAYDGSGGVFASLGRRNVNTQFFSELLHC